MACFFVKAVLSTAVLAACAQAAAVPSRGSASIDAATPVGGAGRLRGRTDMNASFMASRAALPCTCEVSNTAWKPCARTVPRCVFIDLGAADGNTFNFFMNNGYGDVGNCPSAQWAAVLVEANPHFKPKLDAIGHTHAGSVDVMASTAAFMCEAKTSFYLDTVNTDKNYWGSSMSSSHPDVQRSGKTKVTVPTINLNRVLYEQTIPGDWVMVKMDIEGAEWEVLPCLAEAPVAHLVDRLYLEQHPQSWGMGSTTPEQMENAKASLRSKGVDIPNYFSHTL